MPVWNPTKVTEIQKLENFQRSFTSKIAGCRELDYWERLKKLKLMSLQRRRERYCIIHVWKILQKEAPNDTGFTFTMHQRHGLKAEIPAVNKKVQLSIRSDYDTTFRVRAAQLFNILPPELRSITTLGSFKAGLGRFLEQYPDTTSPGIHSSKRQLTAELEEDAHDAIVLFMNWQTLQNVLTYHNVRRITG